MQKDNDAGPSLPKVAKDEKKITKRKRNTTASTTIPPVPGNPSLPLKSKAERNKEKYQEWRQRKRQRDRAPQHVDTASTTAKPAEEADDMTVEIMFTTSTGKIVTSQNIGTILTGYLQAFQKDPSKFIARYEYTLIPPTDINKKWKPDPNHAHQPPPDSLYSCKVIMPPGIEPEYVISSAPGFRSKALAKRDGMGVMVQRLMEAGQISQDLVAMPTGADAKHVGAKDRKDLKRFEHQEKLGKITDPSTAVEGATLNERWTSFKKGIRDRLPTLPESSDGRKGIMDCIPISSPKFWDDSPPFTSSTEFYPTSITLDIEGSGDESKTMCLLTTRSIPDAELMKEIDLTVEEKELTAIKVVRAKAVLRSGPAMTKIAKDQLQSALKFTRCVLNTHLSQPVIGDLDGCRWLLLPMQRDYNPTKHTKIRRRDIDWDEIETGTRDATPFSSDQFATLPHASISDFMFGTADSSRLVYIQPSTTAEAPFEALTALPGRKGGFVKELSSTRTPLPNLQELRTRHPISASVYRTTSMLPAILHRIDSILIARQASETIFESAVSTSAALLALTPRRTSGDLHHSYERLEFLGDTLLKLIGTIDVFARPPSVLSEVEVEKERHLMLSNRMLHKCGEEAGIPPYIRNGRFRTSHWRPAGWKYENGQTVEEPSQTLGLKVRTLA
jgi:endoribonuclease Dicer